MNKILLVLLLFASIGCSSLRTQYEVAHEAVSCRISCRDEGKVPDESKKACSCMSKPGEVKKPEIVKLESLEKQVEALQKKLDEQEKKMSNPVVQAAPAMGPKGMAPASLLVQPSSDTPKVLAPVPAPIKKHKSADPLSDFLNN